MAEVTKGTKYKLVAKTVEVEVPEDEYVLRLTPQEAKTVAMVMGSVSGHITDSRRKHTESIYRELERVGIRYPTPNLVRQGGIRFFSEPGFDD